MIMELRPQNILRTGRFVRAPAENCRRKRRSWRRNDERIVAHFVAGEPTNYRNRDSQRFPLKTKVQAPRVKAREITRLVGNRLTVLPEIQTKIRRRPLAEAEAEQTAREEEVVPQAEAPLETGMAIRPAPITEMGITVPTAGLHRPGDRGGRQCSCQARRRDR